MNLHELSPAAGSTTKSFRKGRGHGSGNGKTAGRVTRASGRSGGGVRVGFRGRPDASGPPYPQARLQQHLR